MSKMSKMSKISIFFSLTLFISVNTIFGQSKEFPTTFGSWVYNLYDPAPTGQNVYYSLSGDSIINGTTYQSINGGSSGFFRTEGKKVYFLPNDLSQEYLSYDFSLVEGDSILAYINGISPSSTPEIHICLLAIVLYFYF